MEVCSRKKEGVSVKYNIYIEIVRIDHHSGEVNKVWGR